MQTVDAEYTKPHESVTLKLYKQRCQTKLSQNSFAVRVVAPWNSLTEKVVQASSVKAFERLLDKYWENQDCMYDHEASLIINLPGSKVNRSLPVHSDGSDQDLDTQE